MPRKKEKKNEPLKVSSEKADDIFGDFEARHNFVGFFDLAYKVDRRKNSHLYMDDKQP